MVYKFLMADFQALEKRLSEYENYLREARAGIGESTTYNSETWHDNPSFDEQQQLAKMWNTERGKLAHVRDDSEIVEPSAPNGAADVGSVVRIKDQSTQTVDTFLIASYMVIGGGEDRISYSTPIAQLLLGHKAGDVVNGRIGSRRVTFEILSVSVSEE